MILHTVPGSPNSRKVEAVILHLGLEVEIRHHNLFAGELRPDLHRYCARMVGSAIDGEDVVQDTLARGYYELSALKEPPALRAWLFRIAHNRALDYLRRYDRRMSEPLDPDADEFIDRASDPDTLLPREQAVTLAIAVRAMLIDDVRLEVVEAVSRRGRKEVGVYFHNYDGRTNWYMVPARLDGREGLAVLLSEHSARAVNFIELTVHQERIARIRDFHHVPYLTADAHLQHAVIAAHCQ